MEYGKTIFLLRPAEAATALGISRSKIYDLLSRRVIPSVRLDGSIRVPAIQLQAWVESQLREQAEAAGR
jgi:excisionase family DNA binding protein